MGTGACGRPVSGPPLGACGSILAPSPAAARRRLSPWPTATRRSSRILRMAIRGLGTGTSWDVDWDCPSERAALSSPPATAPSTSSG
jgi:hypothetical protein